LSTSAETGWTPNSWFSQFVRQWVPDCLTGKGVCTSTKGERFADRRQRRQATLETWTERSNWRGTRQCWVLVLLDTTHRLQGIISSQYRSYWGYAQYWRWGVQCSPV